jgi:hypothetical protein
LKERERRLDQAQDGRRVVPVTPSDISQMKGPPPKNPGPPPPPLHPPSARHYITYTEDPQATYEANEQTARYPGEKPTQNGSPATPQVYNIWATEKAAECPSWTRGCGSAAGQGRPDQEMKVTEVKEKEAPARTAEVTTARGRAKKKR